MERTRFYISVHQIIFHDLLHRRSVIICSKTTNILPSDAKSLFGISSACFTIMATPLVPNVMKFGIYVLSTTERRMCGESLISLPFQNGRRFVGRSRSYCQGVWLILMELGLLAKYTTFLLNGTRFLSTLKDLYLLFYRLQFVELLVRVWLRDYVLSNL